MEQGAIVRMLRDAQERMELEEDLFTFLLFDQAWACCPEGVDEEGAKLVMSALEGLGLRRGHRLDEGEKRRLREYAMEKIGEALSLIGLSMKDGDEIAMDYFGVQRLQWCDMEQLGEVLRDVRLAANH